MTENSSQQTNFRSPLRNKTYGNVLSILSEMFDSLGQKHLLSLIKLRRLWFTEINSFLSKNSFPRNISVLQQFTLNSDFFKQLEKSKISPELLQALKKMSGMNFNRSEQFHSSLGKKLNRLFTKEEKEWLKNKVMFKPKKTILHLTVYDGSISQALRFEKEGYLRIINRLLPEIKIDEIRCHIGDMRQLQLDQNQVSFLAKDWHLITPKEIHQRCMPAFIHRVSRKYTVLVLYVSTLEDLEFLTLKNEEDWIVEHLQKKSFELQGVLRRISFVLKPELDLEKIRFRSIFFGDVPDDNLSSHVDVLNSSKTNCSAKEEFAKIIKNLRHRIV